MTFEFPDVEHIVVIKLDGIGDFMLAIPFFIELRDWCASSKIDVIVRREMVSFLKDCPYFDEVIGIVPWSKRTESQTDFENRVAARLTRQPQLCIIPRWDIDYYGATFLASAIGADIRVGISEHVCLRKAVRNKGYDNYLTHSVVVPEQIVHETDRSLYLLEAFGRAVTNRKVGFWPAKSPSEAEVSLSSNKSIAGFGIGASVAHKQWPIEAFAELARLVVEELQFTVLLLGCERDKPRSQQIIKWLESTGFEHISLVNDLTGKTSLNQLRGVIERCELVVSNDTSVMHFAGALNKPTYVIGAHSPQASFMEAGVPERFAPRTNRLTYFSPSSPVAPCTTHCQANESHCIATVSPLRVFKCIQRDLRRC